MTPKYGSGSQKPSLTPKKDGGKPTPDAGGGGGGLKQKGGPTGPKLTSGRKDDKDKPVFGDVADENLDEALAEVDAQLTAEPDNKEHHIRKFKVLRKMGNKRQEMRTSLQTAAQRTDDPYFGVKLAEALEEEGSYSKALQWRLWVAQKHPDDADTVRRLAATAVRAGDLAIAEQSYALLIELRKDDESPVGGTFYEEMLGKGLANDARLQLQHMGLRLLAQALTYQDSSATLLEAAARLAFRVRDLGAARGFYERAIETNPEHRNAKPWKLELLRVYSNSGAVREWYDLSQTFMKELKEHLQEYRADSRAWTMLAQLQIQAGYFEDAISTLKSAMIADSKNAQALWELGRLYVRMGRSQEAVDYYEEIINDPNEKKTVRRAIERTLADLHFKTGRYQEALELYMRDPESNLRMVAPIFEATGDLATAEDYYNKSIKQSPRDARSHLGVAEYWVRRENWQMAAETGKEGLKCTYATEEVHSNLAVALATAQMKMGEIGDALSTIEEICEAYPDSSHQQFRKVKLLVLLGRKDEALTLAGEVRTSAMHQTGCAPASSSLWSLLGDCSSLLGDIAGAEEAYTNALKYDFMDSVAVRGLGIVAEKKGDLLRALEMYQRFVVLDPLNLATPAIRSRIKELIEKVGPLPEPEPPPPPPTLTPVAPPPAAVAAPATMHMEDGEQQPAPTGAPEGWLGGDDSMDWYDT